MVILISFKDRIITICCDRLRSHFLQEFELEGPKNCLVAKNMFYSNTDSVFVVVLFSILHDLIFIY